MKGSYIQNKFVCPIKEKTYPYRKFIHATLKENLKKYGRKTYNDTLRSIERGCYFIKKRWQPECGEEELERCFSFLKDFLPTLKTDKAYPPAYLSGVIEKEIFIKGEDYFKKVEKGRES